MRRRSSGGSMSSNGDGIADAMFKDGRFATDATGRRFAAAVAAEHWETASMYFLVRTWYSNQGSTKPFLSSTVPNLAWAQISAQQKLLNQEKVNSHSSGRSKAFVLFAKNI